MVPSVWDNNHLFTQKNSRKSRLVRAARETSKFQDLSYFTNSRRRYMTEILPIRRETLSNQSIVFYKLTHTKCSYNGVSIFY